MRGFRRLRPRCAGSKAQLTDWPAGRPTGRSAYRPACLDGYHFLPVLKAPFARDFLGLLHDRKFLQGGHRHEKSESAVRWKRRVNKGLWEVDMIPLFFPSHGGKSGLCLVWCELLTVCLHKKVSIELIGVFFLPKLSPSP